MYIGSLNFDHKNSNLKLKNIHTTRSQSSLSNISTKSTMTKTNFKETPKNTSDYGLEVTQLAKNKHDLEEKILSVMQEMKQLKSVSKNLRDKELEMETISEQLTKSEEEVSEIRKKSEKNESLLSDLLKNLLNNDDDGLTEFYFAMHGKSSKFKSKRNSLIIDDLILKVEANRPNLKTPKDKLKSPYFSHSSLHILTTPKLKKISVFRSNAQTTKSTPKLLNTKEEGIDEKLKITFNRVKNVIENLTKANK